MMCGVRNSPLRFDAFALGQQVDMWLRPNLAKRDFTIPKPMRRILSRGNFKNHNIIVSYGG